MDLEGRIARRIQEVFHKIKDSPTDLRLYQGDLLTEEEAEVRLGKNTSEAYLFARNAADGLWRRCGNVAISHMFEVAERANNLDFDFVYIATSMLHDAIENKAESLEDAYMLAEDISKRFGGEVTENVVAMTNHYAVLIKHMEELTRGTPTTSFSKDILRKALISIRSGAGDDIDEYFREYFGRLMGVINVLDIDEVNQKIVRDTGHTIFDEIKAKTYGFYISDIFDDAIRRYDGSKEGYDVAIIVKGLDNIDNLRTMGVDVPVMEKTLGKMKTYLAHARRFKGILSSDGEENERFLTVYEALKEQLVEQVIARRLAIGQLNDTRYGHALAYLDGKIKEYTTEFSINPNPVAKRLRDQARPLDFQVVN